MTAPSSPTQKPSALELSMASGRLRLEALTSGIIRVRRFASEHHPVPPLIRYGFFRNEWPACQVECEETALTTNLLKVSVVQSTGLLTVAGKETGRELLGECEATCTNDGFRVRFALKESTRFFGLGDQTRRRLEHRGTRGDLWVRNVASYIPIPLVITTDGYGLLFNTTRRLFYDLGATDSEWFGFDCPGGALDYYILYGPSPAEVLDRYTDLTGKPPLPPKWALGLWFICRTQADAREFMDDCYTFRREGIPCDAISLEPGWMAKNYDFSVDKQWHPERFPIPSYAPTGRHNFLSAARRMGFKPGLWLCCDYDLSYEAERRVGCEAAEGEKEETIFAAGHEIDPHFERDRRLDTLTRADEPWFHHLRKFVDQGVEWFKQDGANQVLNHPDRLYGNGMRDEEMHNLYPLLYSQQMYEGFREHTGRRPFGFTVSGWAGLQRWTGTWTGDTGGEEGPLGACLNLSLSGHGMTTCDMEVATKEGIHFGFLLPWAQLNSWNYWRHPWYQGQELTAVFRDYARLRYRLLPYLYSAAREAHVTGMPMLRAMPLAYPDDEQCHALLHQYLLGPDLLVGAFTDTIYLPQGQWWDFWSGNRVDGGCSVTPHVPANRGGPLYVRAGAVLPMGRDMDYVGQRPENRLVIHVYPGPGSCASLYEDDGLTFAYEEGDCRTTELRQEPGPDGMRVTVAAARGDSRSLPEDRELQVVVHGPRPSVICLDGTALAETEDGAIGWTRSEARQQTCIRVGRQDVSSSVVLDISMPG